VGVAAGELSFDTDGQSEKAKEDAPQT